MPVLYDGKKIVPGPFVQIQKQFERTEDGSVKRIFYNITIHSKILAYKGSPMAGVTGYTDGDFWTQTGYPPDTDANIMADPDKRLALLKAKQGALCSLFCQSGKWFEIQPYDGSSPIRFQPRFRDMQIQEGKWFEYFEYTIQMETDELYIGNSKCCANGGDNDDSKLVQEQWAVEQADDKGRSYRITHQLSSESKDRFKTDGSGQIETKGWEIAKNRVLTKLGLLPSVLAKAATVVDIDVWNAYNYVRAYNIDVSGGKFSVTETWLAVRDTDNHCLEEFTISTKSSAEQGTTEVTIDGTVNGLETRNNTTRDLITSRYDNAATAFSTVIVPALLNRAQQYSGATLNPTPLNISIGRNPNNGVITYSYGYNDRPTPIDGALTSVVTVNDRFPADVIAKVPVLNRSLGPILQDTGSNTDKGRTVTIEVTVTPDKYGYTSTKPNVETLLNSYVPTATVGPYVERDEETWVPKQGRYSRTKSWVYE